LALLLLVAGVDLLLISHSPELQAQAVAILEEAYKEGIINDDMIDRSLRRVLKIRSTFKQVEAVQNIDNNEP